MFGTSLSDFCNAEAAYIIISGESADERVIDGHTLTHAAVKSVEGAHV